jgi:CheY-like chemotaxis protein
MSKSASAQERVPRMIRVKDESLYARFRRVLLIDDEGDYRDSLSQNLEAVGYHTTAVNSLGAAAQSLSESRYPLILFDNIFEDHPQMKGSEFIRDQRQLLDNSQVVLVTGWPINQIVDRELLTSRGVRIVQKAPGHIEEIKQICETTVENNIDQVTSKLEIFCDSLLNRIEDDSDLDGLLPDPRLISRARSYLRNYLLSLPNQELEQFYIKGETFTPRRLVIELDIGSDVAASLIDQLLDDLLEGPNE